MWHGIRHLPRFLALFFIPFLSFFLLCSLFDSSSSTFARLFWSSFTFEVWRLRLVAVLYTPPPIPWEWRNSSSFLGIPRSFPGTPREWRSSSSFPGIPREWRSSKSVIPRDSYSFPGIPRYLSWVWKLVMSFCSIIWAELYCCAD